MNYPVWEIPVFGGGFFIMLIATVHVFVSHFAVGGGLFLVLTEMKARRENNDGMLSYVKGHTKFFLLITMVMGALTGVGIWLVISVLHPSGTSVLIHAFVFGWATEWVFFIVEIVSLLVYYYTFHKMDPRSHVIIGWIYFIAAWISLAIIDGIISFMLTSGSWPETRSFWAGIFNPSYLPSLVFRTAFALILAGVYGLITSTNIKDDSLRRGMIRYCVLWLVVPFIILLPSGYWYLQVVPDYAKGLILGASPEMSLYTGAFLLFTPIIILAGIFTATKLQPRVQKLLAFVLLIIAFLYIGSFEMIREAGRRPYIIYEHMYSNSILKSELAETRENGVLKNAKWIKNREIDQANPEEAGRDLFNFLCLSCHTMGGIRNDIFERIQGMTPEELETIVDEMGQGKGFMPTFPGNEEERDVLVKYLIESLQKEAI